MKACQAVDTAQQVSISVCYNHCWNSPDAIFAVFFAFLVLDALCCKFALHFSQTWLDVVTGRSGGGTKIFDDEYFFLFFVSFSLGGFSLFDHFEDF